MFKLFSSNKCSPCKKLKEILERKKIKYEEINIDTEEGWKEAKRYGVKAVPTLIKGNWALVGLPQKEEELDEILKEMSKL